MVTNQDLIKLFEYALHQEETGKSFFQASLNRMGWGAALSAFNQLIKEEDHHNDFINKILDGLKKGNLTELQTVKDYGVETTNYFDERAKSEFLQQQLYETMVPDVTVFNVAWLIEKDLSEFYDKMACQTDGAAREAFKMLSDWERGHERFFREFRDKANEAYKYLCLGG
jgi:rubrerythrin